MTTAKDVDQSDKYWLMNVKSDKSNHQLTFNDNSNAVKLGLGRGQVKAAERKVRTWTRPGQIGGK